MPFSGQNQNSSAGTLETPLKLDMQVVSGLSCINRLEPNEVFSVQLRSDKLGVGISSTMGVQFNIELLIKEGGGTSRIVILTSGVVSFNIEKL